MKILNKFSKNNNWFLLLNDMKEDPNLLYNYKRYHIFEFIIYIFEMSIKKFTIYVQKEVQCWKYYEMYNL
jgi:hypothetical protein